MKIGKKYNKGITLIALIITIIVLLILAAVSISVLTGENGILIKAEQSRDASNEGEEQEQIKIAYMSAKIKTSGNDVDKDDLQDELNSSLGNNKTQVTGGRTLKVKFLDSKNIYKVTPKGVVSKYEDVPDDIFVALYNDGTLVFSNNESAIDSQKVTKNYNNIKDSTSYPVWLESDSDNINKVEILNKIRPKTTSYWFDGLINLTEINVENINTENVTDMSGMFSCCVNLDTIDVSSLDTSNVTNMYGMFYVDDDFVDCKSFPEIKGLTSFDTRKVTDMENMFKNCKVTELDLSSFDTSNVTNMSGMFTCCKNLRRIYASNWDTSKLSYEHSWQGEMFYQCISLVGGNGTTFNSSNTTYDFAHIDGGTSNPGYFTRK